MKNRLRSVMSILVDKAIRSRISLTNPWHFCALGFGSGLAPFMPGTFGTLAGLPLVFISIYMPPWSFLVVCIVISLIGITICERTAKDMKVHDHGAIVWDEIAGILITFLWVPLSLTTLTLGFLLFRLFDIAKPWPIQWIDKKVDGGLGIMLDDIIAGLLACLCLHLILHFHIMSG